MRRNHNISFKINPLNGLYQFGALEGYFFADKGANAPGFSFYFFHDSGTVFFVEEAGADFLEFGEVGLVNWLVGRGILGGER